MGTHPIFESDFDCLTETMTKLSCLVKNRITAQLKKIAPESFDEELPDYILLLLGHRKPKREVIKDLEVFLSPKQTQELVDWLFDEIEALKLERKIDNNDTKKAEKKRMKKEKKSRSKRTPSPISLSSESDPEPPPLDRGRRERIKSNELSRRKSSRSSRSSSYDSYERRSKKSSRISKRERKSRKHSKKHRPRSRSRSSRRRSSKKRSKHSRRKYSSESDSRS